MQNIKLAQMIRDQRMSHSWSQAQLAEIAGLSIRTIQRIESKGKYAHETLLALAAAFDLDVQDLVQTAGKNNDDYEITMFNKILLSLNLTPKKVAITSFICAFPAVYFILANISKYMLGVDFLAQPLNYFYSDPQIFYWFNQLSPIVFLGGLCIAVVINLLSIIRGKIMFSKRALNASVSLKLNPVNLIILFACAGFALILLGYAAIENLL